MRMRIATVLVLLLPLGFGGSGAAQPPAGPSSPELQQAQAEQALAEGQAARFQRAAEAAQGTAGKLRAEQEAAAHAIEAAEARISASGLHLQAIAAALSIQRRAIAEQQRPVSSLLAGLALMGERPPLLALADRGSFDGFVRVRILLNATMPAIRVRTAAAVRQLAAEERLQAQAAAARAQLIQAHKALDTRRARFAELERQALQVAGSAGTRALSAGDQALAAGETLDRIKGNEAAGRAGRALAAALASDSLGSFAGATTTAPSTTPFPYQLPANAAVTDGLGTVSDSGIRSRGITIATIRGAAVAAPARGVVRFAGPFRSFDGIIIVDHGGGWTSLIVNVAPDVKVGQTVTIGQPIGRALGPLDVELSANDRRYSPALIAGSSAALSNAAEGR